MPTLNEAHTYMNAWCMNIERAGSSGISQIKVAAEYLIKISFRIKYFLSPLDLREAIPRRK